MFKYLIYLVLLAFAIPLFGQQVEPFSAKEGLAIEIYETALPLLEATESLFEGDSADGITFDEIKKVAKEADIDLDPIEDAIVGDPNMASFAVAELKGYAKDNMALAEDAEEPKLKEAFRESATAASRHAQTLELLIQTWVGTSTEEVK